MSVTVNYTAAGGGGGGSGASSAGEVSYDNGDSGLTADTVQEAIDEIASQLGGDGAPPPISGTVSNYASLPSAATNTNKLYAVTTASGTLFVNRKPAGVYRSDGDTWIYVADFTEHDQASEIEASQTGFSVLTGTTVQAVLDAADEALDNRYTKSAADFLLDGKAGVTHGHAISDVSGLQTALDGKQPSGSYADASHTHAISDTTGLQTALDGKASTSHGHAISDITNLQTELDGKQASGSYAAASHTHAISDVTGLQSALDGKTNTGHSHAISDVTGLQTALDGKASSSHGHAISDVTGLQTALDGKAASNHEHVISHVTGLQTALDGKQPLATVLTNTTAAFTTAQETKLAGIATAATANSSDASLRDRTTHTGEQAISTVTGLQTALDAKQATLVSATNIKTINGASVLGSGDLTVTGSGAEPVHFIRQGSNYTLTSTTDGQKIFNTTANGALTLPTGIYQFECGLYLLSMSGSSGNASFQLNGSGTATVTSVFYSAVGLDNSSPLNSSARGGSISVSSSSVTNGLGTAGTGTGLASYVTGIFEVTVTGTIIPRIALTTAAAAVLQANSFFKCQKIAATGVTATSEWS